MTIKSESESASESHKIFRSKRPDNARSPYKSLGQAFLHLLSTERANTIVYIEASTGRELRGAELAEKVLNVACALTDLHDFKAGDAICISYNHSIDVLILALAVIVAGGIVACCYPKDPYAELLYQARRVEPRLLFCHEKNSSWAKRLELDLGVSVHPIAMDHGDAQNTIERFSQLLDYDSSKSKALERLPFLPEDPGKLIALISFSSGTTGMPKAIPVTHAACLSSVSPSKSMVSSTAGSRVACSASLDYVSGRLVCFNAIVQGYTAVIIDDFTPGVYLSYVQRYKINVIYLGAASFYSLIAHPKVDQYDLSSVRVVFPMGAKVIYMDKMREFLGKNPQVRRIIQGYGASELSGVALQYMTPEEYLRDPDNCGQLYPSTEAKIVDTTTGKLLGVNERGSLRIRPHAPFPGYYDVRRIRVQSMTPASDKEPTDDNGNLQSPELSPFVCDSSVHDEDGFYLTGDIAYFNENEELYIVGREKELMSCRGAKKVVPQELEEVIGAHPAVAKVCVLGVANQREPTLHCPRAFVVARQLNEYDHGKPDLRDANQSNLQDGEQQETLEHKGCHKLSSLDTERRRALAADLMKYVNTQVGWEKQLTGGIVILDEIPTSRATGKMDKQYLRSLSLDQVEIYGDRSC